MRNSKLWLALIVMIAVVGLVSAPVFAGKPLGTETKGETTSKAHASEKAQTNDKVSDNAAFKRATTEASGGDDVVVVVVEPTSECPEGQFYFEGMGCI